MQGIIVMTAVTEKNTIKAIFAGNSRQIAAKNNPPPNHNLPAIA